MLRLNTSSDLYPGPPHGGDAKMTVLETSIEEELAVR